MSLAGMPLFYGLKLAWTQPASGRDLSLLELQWSRHLVVVLLLDILHDESCNGRARHQLITQTNCQLSLSLSPISHL